MNSTTPVIGSAINPTALNVTQTTDYVGNVIYENGTLKRILVDGGYNDGGNYYFYINDHLGNNRIVANAAASVVQSTQYYPFGMPFADATGPDVQPYKYNNKELDGRNGLNMYDNFARLYDPVIPHTPMSDPHAEKYYNMSPYSWIGNNPMKVIDPSGMDTTHVAYNSMDNQDYQIQANLSGGEGMIVVDNPLPDVFIDGVAPIKSPFDYWAISLSGSAVCGVGFYGDITIGIIGKDGIFIQPSIGFGGGLDISGSVNIKQGVYKGAGKPTATSLEGTNRDISGGASFVNMGYSEDRVETYNSRNIVTSVTNGNAWNVYSGGVTFGSKSIVGGHFGLSQTFGTTYLYKK